MKERDFLSWVTDVAVRFQWRFWHVPAPMLATRGGFVGAKHAAGLPDLILIHHDPPRLIFAELKGTAGKLTVDQQEFLRLARDVARICTTASLELAARGQIGSPVGVYAWNPADQDMIEQILRTRVLL